MLFYAQIMMLNTKCGKMFMKKSYTVMGQLMLHNTKNYTHKKNPRTATCFKPDWPISRQYSNCITWLLDILAGLLQVEEQVEIIQCRICTADQTVHSNFEQLVDMLDLFTQLPWTPATYCAQFGLPYKFYTEEFPLAVLHATVQYINL